jgi:hypothetical protein
MHEMKATVMFKPLVVKGNQTVKVKEVTTAIWRLYAHNCMSTQQWCQLQKKKRVPMPISGYFLTYPHTSITIYNRISPHKKLSLCLIKRHDIKTYWGVEVQLHHSWPGHQMEMSGQLYSPATLLRVPIKWEAAWAPETVWALWSRKKRTVAAGNRTLSPSLYRMNNPGSHTITSYNQKVY